MMNENNKAILKSCRSETNLKKRFTALIAKRLPETDPIAIEAKALIALADLITNMTVDSDEALIELLRKQDELRERSEAWRRSLIDGVMQRAQERRSE